MRIGILTLHSGANYGGTLQCVALYKTLESLGHQVEVIDFKPTQVTNFRQRLMYNLSCVRSISDIVALFRRSSGRSGAMPRAINSRLRVVFEQFRSVHLCFSASVNEDSIALLNNNYDCIVVGSDQVWGSFVRNRLTYWGDWTPAFPGKLVSYAACATSEKFPLVRKRRMADLLSRFTCISVRDSTTQNLVKSLIGKEMPIVLDPTFLYNFHEFTEQPLIAEPYIFVYVLGHEIEGGNRAAIDLLRQKLNKPCKVIAVTVYDQDVSYADTTIKDASPEQWVNLIAHAEFVFTDSFHGSVFALKNNVRFLAYYSEINRASRLVYLSRSFLDGGCVVSSLHEISKALESDCVGNQIIIDAGINASMSYLKQAL